MAAHKYIDRICLTGALISLVISVLFMNGQALGIQAAARTMGYEARLFDTSRVHTIDIAIDDWDSFIEGCENEEYVSCAVLVDKEAYKNVGLRAKGNTSLSTVSQLDSDRYSFKIEFDHYDSGRTYHGLDKLSLNNAIQDNTFMKDYLTYRLMAEFGANAPLCSFAYITVNGEDWGLYLAIEGVEDSFLQRNYGQNHGRLYKPDSLSFGGGRGNGMDFAGGDFRDFVNADIENDSDFGKLNVEDFSREGFEPGSFGSGAADIGGFGGRGDGMGSSDTKLQYIDDDDPGSYANIFNNAKTDVTDADQARLIQSLKSLGQGGDISDVVDIDQVLRYFVVHNFVVNGDSYTGSMVHNYYLYEDDGKLSMLPWDYNLAFGTFTGSSADSAVNDPIDTPLSVTGSGDRPMIDWIFSSEEYTRLYHEYFAEFLNIVAPDVIINEAYGLIASYVEKDPTKFCTYEEFEIGINTLKTFCTLRAESVSRQLAGITPSTSAGQREQPDALVDASVITMSNMGTMSHGGMGGTRPGNGEMGRQNEEKLPVFGAASRSQPNVGDEPASKAGNGEDRPASSGTILAQTDGINGSTSGQHAPEGSEMDQGGETPDWQPPGGAMGPINSGGRFPGAGLEGYAPADGAAQSVTTLILLGVSVLVLLAGLTAAVKFKR